MTYGYVPQPVLSPVRPPKRPYRVSAVVSWVCVNIWNTLNALAWLAALILSIVGTSVLVNRWQRGAAEVQEAGVGPALGVMVGSASAVTIGFFAVGFVVVLSVTICTYYRLWPALMIQTVWYGLCNLIATAVVLQPQVRHELDGNWWLVLVAIWGLWLVWLLFTILTAPGDARRAVVA